MYDNGPIIGGLKYLLIKEIFDLNNQALLFSIWSIMIKKDLVPMKVYIKFLLKSRTEKLN